MKIVPCRGENSIADQFKKIAAKDVLATVKVKTETAWEDAKPIVAEAIKKAAEAGPVEESDIVKLFERLAKSGVKVADGTPEGLVKEAQAAKNWIGKGMEWMGKGMQGIGNAAKGVGNAVQQGFDAAVNLPQTLQNAGQNMQNQAYDQAKVTVDQQAQSFNQIMPNLVAAYKAWKSDPSQLSALQSAAHQASQTIAALNAAIGKIPQRNFGAGQPPAVPPAAPVQPAATQPVAPQAAPGLTTGPQAKFLQRQPAPVVPAAPAPTAKFLQKQR